MLKSIFRIPGAHLKNSSSCFSTGCSKCNVKIAVPKRIPRGDTDILKALAATVHQDTNGPQYQYYDDPYLTPLSNSEKRMYSLSRESGRKAAMFIRDENQRLFQHQPDDPVIEKFLPKAPLNENVNPTEDVLCDAIENIRVADAMKMYQICGAKGVDLSDECLQSLLELICFQNAEESVDEEWMTEIKTRQVFEKRIVRSWKDGGVAEEIFNKLSSNGSKPYCALIRGMCKYYQAERAWQLYQESLEKSLILDTETFSSLISLAPILWESYSDKWMNMKELWERSVSQGLPPTLSLMNRILDALDKMLWDESLNISLSVIKEFKKFGIEPSLATYASLLGTYRKRKFSKSTVLHAILKSLDGQSLSIRDTKDTWFFFKAMEVSCKNLQCWETAEKIHSLLLQGDNYNLMGENLKEAIYYRYYFLLAIESLSFDKFMEIYDNLVPHIYTPEKTVVEEIIKSIGVQGLIDCVPRMWTDIIKFDYVLHDNIVESILMVISMHNLEESSDTLKEQLTNVSYNVWTSILDHLTNERIVKKRIEWTGAMFGDCIGSLAKLESTDKIKEIIAYLVLHPTIIVGEIPPEALHYVAEWCSRNKEYGTLLSLLKFMKEHEYPGIDGLAKCIDVTLLTKQQRDILKFHIGVV